jgi:pimeloyl-ACP methyl ester carboxylesterase
MRTLWRILGALGLGWMVWRLFGPEVEPAYEGEQKRPIHVPGRTVFFDEREFFVREAGPQTGRPLVLIHGWGFDGEMNFFSIIPPLAERFRIVAPDHRNHGKSDRIRGRFEIEDLAREAVGVIDALGYDEFDLFGFSMGGMAAQVMARDHPGRVGRLILAGTAAHPVDRFRPVVWLAFRVARAVARCSKKEMVAFTYRFLVSHRIVESSYERWMWAALLNRDPSLFYESSSAAWRFDSRAWVGDIQVPTLVIIPSEDRVVPVSEQRDLAERIGAERVVLIEGAGHESPLTRPDEYVRAITGFLDGQPRGDVG